jgi:hypothetical protein
MLSVGYWLIPTNSQSPEYELVRYSCVSGGSTPIQAVITNDLTSPTQVTATVAPAQFESVAATGWTPTTQTNASISNVTISLMEPGSDYAYTLPASPRTQSGAALVSLGNVTLSNTANIAVNGNVSFKGTLSGQLTASGTVQQTTNATDLLAADMPKPVTVPANTVTGSACNITSPSAVLNPGTYTCQLNIGSGATAQLNPGVYMLERGITVASTGTLTYSSSGQPGYGVLLYLPCRTGANGCNEAATFASGASINLPPLNSSQSQAASSSATTNPTTTALQGMWFWQAATDGSTAHLVGNGQGGQASGIAYAPSATVDLSNSSGNDATGEILAGGINASGTASFTITGP